MKVFLSHSSADKESIVRPIANYLTKDRVHYDEWTFEQGENTLDEIIHAISKTDLFVLLISSTALDSRWVKDEICEAKRLLDEHSIRRFYPIIIDKNISYSDPRIPQWIRETYNLRVINQASIISRRIQDKLTRLSLLAHPPLKAKHTLFVGRNLQVKEFEERIDSINLDPPVCLIASGMPSIGRRSFLKHAMRKATLISDTYEPIVIQTSSSDSIEDVIIKIHGTGATETKHKEGFMEIENSKKLEILSEMTKELTELNEKVIIIDDGAIILNRQTPAPWFKELINRDDFPKSITLCIASKYAIRPQELRTLNNVLSVKIPELSPKERENLFVRYSKALSLETLAEPARSIGKRLGGFPDQIFYCVDLIKSKGANWVNNNFSTISDFGEDKATLVIQKHLGNEEAITTLRFLSEFEIISYSLIFDLLGIDINTSNHLEEFLAEGIIEEVGSDKEFVRISDSLRDAILRRRLKLDSKLQTKLKSHVKNYVFDDDMLSDTSDFLYSLKEKLKRGEDIPERLLLPSHFLKAIKELYDRNDSYNEVIRLSDHYLEFSNKVDEIVTNQVRYYLCLALARNRNSRFLDEVSRIEDKLQHCFLLGFYHRQIGKFELAEKNLKKALKISSNFSRAKRELVQVLIPQDRYSEALGMARDNFQSEPGNPFHIQAYFECLLRNHPYKQKELYDLLTKLGAIPDERAKEMHIICSAKMIAFSQNDPFEALRMLETVIEKKPNSIHAIRAKFQIAKNSHNRPAMRSSLEKMQSLAERDETFKHTLRHFEEIYQKYKG